MFVEGKWVISVNTFVCKINIIIVSKSNYHSKTYICTNIHLVVRWKKNEGKKMIYNNVIWCNIIEFKSDRQRTQKHQILIRMVLITMFFISIAQCFPPECENFCPYGRVRDSNGCQTCKCKPPSK